MAMQTELFGGAASAEELPVKIGKTSVSYIRSRDILTKATGFMSEYDYTLNPYAGCGFGCSYCYAAFFAYREADGESWGEWVRVKANAAALLGRRKVGDLDGKLIYMSNVTDPYQPVERKLGLTRRLLEIMAERHKVRLVVQTRSQDVVRDIDLFRAIEANGGRVQVNMTITTDDDDVRKAFESGCASNAARLRAISKVRGAGVQCCVTMTPLLMLGDPHPYRGDVLSSEAEGFIDDLLATGIDRFIMQPFHFGEGKFVAGTSDKALFIARAKLYPGAEIKGVAAAYMDRYEAHAAALRARLPNLGEGKAGFAPPF